METKSSRPKGRRLDPRKIHLATIRSFVINYCSGFSWNKRADGATRAGDFPTLLNLANEVNIELIRSATRDESRNTEYAGAAKYHAASQFVALVTKYQYPTGVIPGQDPKHAALENLLRAERRSRRLNTVFRAHNMRGTERHWSIPMIRKELHRVLGDVPPYERVFDQCDFSGGATVQHHGENTHLATKLGGDTIQGRASALNFFKIAVWRNWHYAEQFLPLTNVWDDIKGSSYESNDAFPRIRSLDREAFERAIERRFEDVDYNKITTVPKNAMTERTIAMEPELNNFLQKGADLVLRDLIHAHYGIDLSQQEPNQILAWRGSLDNTSDPYATLDLKDASNSVLLEFVRAVLPPSWFRFLDAIRSPCYQLEGKLHAYEMFCSMGNGFCFPLETLIFAAICKVAAKYSKVKSDFRCYGDDIIIRQSQALLVTEILRVCGFRINIQKSYVFGPFRESCGANWYDGRAVTPGYYKTAVTTRDELYAIHNSLPWPEVQATIRGFIPDGHVVEDIPYYAWVSNQAFKVPQDIAMSSKHARWDKKTQRWVYKILLGTPHPDKNWEREFEGNSPEDMRFTAVLRGSAAEAPFHLRHKTKYRSVFTDTLDARVIADCLKKAKAWTTMPASLGVAIS